jgi:hypothetical protein
LNKYYLDLNLFLTKIERLFYAIITIKKQNGEKQIQQKQQKIQKKIPKSSFEAFKPTISTKPSSRNQTLKQSCGLS